jgi:hypothetical protein
MPELHNFVLIFEFLAEKQLKSKHRYLSFSDLKPHQNDIAPQQWATTT